MLLPHPGRDRTGDTWQTPWSGWVTVAPSFTAPTLGSAGYADNGVSLSFTAPSVPTGATITSYDYEISTDGGTSIAGGPFNTVSYGRVLRQHQRHGKSVHRPEWPRRLWAEHHVLLPIRAEIGAGDTWQTPWSGWVTVAPSLTAPTLDSALSVDDGVSLSFTAPSVPTGATITSYDYEISTDGGTSIAGGPFNTVSYVGSYGNTSATASPYTDPNGPGVCGQNTTCSYRIRAEIGAGDTWQTPWSGWVTINVSSPPLTFTADGTNGSVPLATTFHLTSSDPNAGTVDYTIAFGDGTSTSGQINPPYSTVDVAHTYATAGSYEATATVTNAGGAASTAAVSVDATAPTPTNTQLPTITGTDDAGDTLTQHQGSWTDSPTSYAEQWELCNAAGANCQPIPGAGGQQYTITPADIGSTVSVSETASNANGAGTPAQSAPTMVVSAVPLSADAGDPITTAVNAAATFDASGSSPAGLITNYQWDFGDGTSANGQTVQHTYASPGSYTVTLTVSEGATTATATVAVTVTSAAAAGAAVTVKDSNGNPIPGASVVYIAPDGTDTNVATDGTGVANLPGLPDGTDAVYAWASGYQVGTGQITIANGDGSTTITLQSGEVATASMSSTQLTLQQIEAAGINTSDPANQNVYQFTVALNFPPQYEGAASNPPVITGYVNGAGQYVGNTFVSGGGGGGGGGAGGGGGGGSGGGGGDSCTATECQGPGFVAVPTIVDGAPLIEWLVLSGDASVLKQFFSVDMVVNNLASSAVNLADGSATLNLPAGLSLAPTATPQAATQSVPTIQGNSSANVDWVVRGDTPGNYYLSASYDGTLQPFNIPINLQASLQNPIEVWGANGLSLTVLGDSGTLAAGQPYHVTLALKNVADVPFYNVGLSIDSSVHKNYIFQPDETFSDTISELDPGQTLYSHTYILVPDAASAGPFDPSTSFITFAGQQEPAGQGITQVTPPPLYSISALTDTPGYVHLHWDSVPGATGYEVFSTPNLDTPFAGTPDAAAATPGGNPSTSPLPASATDAYLAASNGSDRYYAVSTLIDGTPTLEHTVIEASPGLSAGPPSASISSPADGQTYNLNQSVPSSFSCSEASGGPGIASCVDSNGASGGSGALDTSTAGTFTYTVTATSADGQTGTASISYTVLGPPSASISSPANGGTYNLNQAVATSFTCADSSGGPGIQSCTDSNGSASPGTLDTATAGTFTDTVTAASSDGQTGTATIHYTVLGPPSASIGSPAGGGTYNVGQVVPTSFSCSEASGGPGLSSCLDSNGESSPGALDTSTVGPHSYTVTATSSDGQTGTASISYTVIPAVVGPPSASISKPAGGQTYNLNQVVATSFLCSDASGAPGIQSCIDSNGASGGSGALGTSTAGTFTYTVTATSKDGQTGTASISYTVLGPPTATISRPASNQTYNLNQVVATTFACTEAAHGPGIATCIDSNGATTGTGQLNTSTAGTFTYKVTATSQDGQTATASVSYTVLGPPTATITSPANNRTYKLNQTVATKFSCADAAGAPGIASCADSNGASGTTGQLKTSEAGTFTYTVTATSKDGQTGTASITYTVSSPPTATIGSPANNQTFNLGQTVPTSFNCADPNGPGMATCVDSNGASAGAGQLGTSKAGTFTYKVTATSQDGQTGTASISYTVAGPPTAKITAPANHQTYNLSQVVATTFACTEAAHGPGIATCVDSGGATGGTGQLNTSTAGTFTYTVTATSQDGQTGTASITYTVAGPPTMTITAPSNRCVVCIRDRSERVL